MRKLLAAVAAASLAAAAPASAAPVAHVVVVSGNPANVSVTCDTSSYPAAVYPCDIAVVVTATGCTDFNRSAVGPCTLAIRGALFGRPAASWSGRCSFQPDGPARLTFESIADPAFRVDEAVGSWGVVPSAQADVGATGVATQYVADFLPLLNGGGTSPYFMAGAITAGFSFSDLQWDCRTRAGGSPASDVAPGTLLHLAPNGAVVLTRV